MENTILNWNGVDYAGIYTRQLKENPVWFDANLNCHVVYSNPYCKAILSSPDAHVPELNIVDMRLSETTRLLAEKLARITNGDQHEVSRAAAFSIWERLFRVDFGELTSLLLKDTDTEPGFDWVETVAKRLPIMAILQGLGIAGGDREYIAAHLQVLVRLMSPNKSDSDIAILNPVVDEIYRIAERHVQTQRFSAGSETIELIACNLVGLFIQCYDGGRGLLCESLLNLAKFAGSDQCETDPDFFKKLVTETLRLNPPVHNTRRVAAKELNVNGHKIKKGEVILVVLGAANLDLDVFAQPLAFDLNRSNNHQHLTFGVGGHNCLAKHFSAEMAAGVCHHLTAKYGRIDILQKEWHYEPQLNVRLARALKVSLGRC